MEVIVSAGDQQFNSGALHMVAISAIAKQYIFYETHWNSIFFMKLIGTTTDLSFRSFR